MQEELWQEDVKNFNAEAIIKAISGIKEGQDEIVKNLDTMNKRHEATEAELSNIKRAFPNGDYDGHRRYHETMIEMLAEKRRLRMAVQEKTISGLVWSGIVIVMVAVYKYAKGG